MTSCVYINATDAFFPNAPVANENVEAILGFYKGKNSKSKSLVLGSNQIQSRHYAIDPQTRRPTHTNAQMAAGAVLNLMKANPDLSLSEARLMVCGTSSPDLIIPAHGQMVQGHIEDFRGDVMTTAGVCCSSSAALKIAFLSIMAGDTNAAIVTGSESASKHLRSEFLESETDAQVEALKNNPMVAFEHEFLRWMLSDGAGAFYLSNQPVEGKTNLRINWIEGRSYASEEPVCMMAGGHKEKDGSVTPWRDVRLLDDPVKQKHVLSLRQDIRQLRDRIAYYTVERAFTEVKKKHGLKPGDYRWFLPHYSSHFFKPVLIEALRKVEFEIPDDCWFTSLYEKGNVGSASIFVFVNELLKKQTLKKGEKILCYVPESARFGVYYFELEAV